MADVYGINPIVYHTQRLQDMEDRIIVLYGMLLRRKKI